MTQRDSKKSGTRSFQRSSLDPRPLEIVANYLKYAEGSVLIRCGNTHVICSASVEESVPGWLKGKGQGWVTAEYSMLPRATHTRGKRDREKVSGRTQEIQRLIGRALRSMVDMKQLGERSILVDCDVIQADGGTRTASITGACVALVAALKHLEKNGKIMLSQTLLDTVAAVSLGMKDGEILVDLDYEEDSSCDVDMNFVAMGSGKFVEVQGTAERRPFDLKDFHAMTDAALQTLNKITELQRQAISAL